MVKPKYEHQRRDWDLIVSFFSFTRHSSCPRGSYGSRYCIISHYQSKDRIQRYWDPEANWRRGLCVCLSWSLQSKYFFLFLSCSLVLYCVLSYDPDHYFHNQGETVAVKQIKDAPVDSADGVFAEFRREVWGMSGLRHENIVKLVGFCMSPCCIVSDFIPNGNLYEYIYNESLPLDLPFLLRIATDIAKGLRFLQNLTPPIIHCDLKSPNILVSLSRLSIPKTSKNSRLLFCWMFSLQVWTRTTKLWPRSLTLGWVLDRGMTKEEKSEIQVRYNFA